jgi:YegS/Rv2252/BmrU family lipid kinase
MNRYYFIINPASRKGSIETKKEITTFFDTKKAEAIVEFWTPDRTVQVMVDEAIENGFNTVVACGGDGTIMEVGKALVGCEINMGIIPLGSGNGIARHFSIPTDIQEALEILTTQKTQKMDVGKANEHYFFGNIGFGIEVDFIKAYQRKKRHGLLAYGFAFWNALFRFHYTSFELIEQDQSTALTPYTLMISNTNEQGYGRTLTPSAKTNDGKLNLVSLPKQNWVKLSLFMLQIGLFKQPLQRKKLLEKEVTQIQIKGTNLPFPIQIDGEYLEIEKNTIAISVLKGGLTIITG